MKRDYYLTGVLTLLFAAWGGIIASNMPSESAPAHSTASSAAAYTAPRKPLTNTLECPANTLPTCMSLDWGTQNNITGPSAPYKTGGHVHYLGSAAPVFQAPAMLAVAMPEPVPVLATWGNAAALQTADCVTEFVPAETQDAVYTDFTTGTDTMQYVQVTASVPEPGVWAMLLTGFFLLGAFTRATRHRRFT